MHPAQLVLEELAARVVLLLEARHERLLLLEPRLVVALPRVGVPAVELEDPFRDVREEVAVVRDDDERSLELLEVGLEPRDALRVEVVRGLVEEEDVGIGKQEPRERDAAALAAGERRDVRVRGRQAQRLHRELDVVVELPEVPFVDFVLEAAHLRVELVELRVVRHLAQEAADLVVAVELRLRLGDALAHALLDGLGRVELRLLRQIADTRGVGDDALPHELRVLAGEDLEERRLAGAVHADDADVGAVEEREVDVLEHGLGAVLLGDVDEGDRVFAGHVASPAVRRRRRAPPGSWLRGRGRGRGGWRAGA